MLLSATCRNDIESQLGLHILEVLPAPHGDINQSAKLVTSHGDVFLKFNQPGRLAMFAAEAAALAELAATEIVKVPHALGFGVADRAWLALEWLDLRPASPGSQETLGRQLARLHAVSARRFGWQCDNTIGTTLQPNPWTQDWTVFYGQHRLAHQLQRLPTVDAEWAADMSTLIAGLAHFYQGYQPSPSLLHGDLWGGNQAALDDGTPVLFDPACWYGDRESDIAMSELFGGFGEVFYAAYNCQWPLDTGYASRRELHQLYHVFNHANLFGGSYVTRAREMTARLARKVRG